MQVDLNYVIGDGGQVAASATGSVLQSATITTSGFPVRITVTGDGEPASNNTWHELQIFRDSTAVGEIVHVESNYAGQNVQVAMSVIDTPVSGTYTYSVKIVKTNNKSITYSDTGQLTLILEEMIISTWHSMSWLRRDIVPPSVYYGYNNDMNAADSDNNWSIKKITTSGTVETVKWTNGSAMNMSSKWSNRVNSFVAPTGNLGFTFSKVQSFDGWSLSLTWNILSGVDQYVITVRDAGGNLCDTSGTPFIGLWSSQKTYTDLAYNTSYNTNRISVKSGATYSISLAGTNVAGATTSTITQYFS